MKQQRFRKKEGDVHYVQISRKKDASAQGGSKLKGPEVLFEVGKPPAEQKFQPNFFGLCLKPEINVTEFQAQLEQYRKMVQAQLEPGVRDALTAQPRAISDFAERDFDVDLAKCTRTQLKWFSEAHPSSKVRFELKDLLSAPARSSLAMAFTSAPTAFDDLKHMLCAPSPKRYHGIHDGFALMLVGESLSGKTAALVKLAFALAEGSVPDATVALPILPVFISAPRLAEYLGKWTFPFDKPTLLHALEDFVATEYPSVQHMLRACVRMRACLFILDSLDRAMPESDQAWGQVEGKDDGDGAARLEQLLVNELAANGHRVLAAARPHARIEASFQAVPEVSRRSSKREGWARFVLLRLKPLSNEQQEALCSLTLHHLNAEEGPQLRHLFAFGKIRQDHDALYGQKMDRRVRYQLETMMDVDGFQLRGSGRWVPEMRQYAIGGKVCVKYSPEAASGKPQSQYWKGVMKLIDKQKLIMLDDALEAAQIDATALVSNDEAQLLVRNVFGELGHKHAKLLARMLALAHKRKAPSSAEALTVKGNNLEATDMVTLFDQVVGRTDEIYMINEKYQKMAIEVLIQRLQSIPTIGLSGLRVDKPPEPEACQDEQPSHQKYDAKPLKRPANLPPKPKKQPTLRKMASFTAKPIAPKAEDALAQLSVGPMKDAARLHEKACDDYITRFPDDLAEACVTDVLRATLILRDDGGSSLIEVLRTLQRDEEEDRIPVGGGKYEVRLQMVRRKNKFLRNADPTHFRNVLLNLRLTFDVVGADAKVKSDAIFLELQLHYAPIRQLNEASNAHMHYEFFRSTLQERYAFVLDQQIDALLRYFSAGSGSPITANLLSLNFHKGACLRNSRVGLPRSLIDMYEDAIREYLALTLPRIERLGIKAAQVQDAEVVTPVVNACYEMFYWLAKLISEASNDDIDCPVSVDQVLPFLQGGKAAAGSNGLEMVRIWSALHVAGERGFSRELPPFLEDVPGTPDVADGLPVCEGVRFILSYMSGFFQMDTLVEECTKKPAGLKEKQSKAFEGIINQSRWQEALRFGGGLLAEQLCDKGLTKWEFAKMDKAAFNTLMSMLDSDSNGSLGATHHARFSPEVDLKVETLALPSELSETFTDEDIDRLISALNHLHHLKQVKVQDRPCGVRLDIPEIKGFTEGQAGSRTLFKPGKAAGQIQGRMEPASSALVCGLAIDNPALTDINLVGNNLREIGARAAARLVMSHVGLRHLRLDECTLGCSGMLVLCRGLMASASGQMMTVSLAFNLGEKQTSDGDSLSGLQLVDKDEAICTALSQPLAEGLSSVLGSSSCPRSFNLQGNLLGRIFSLSRGGGMRCFAEQGVGAPSSSLRVLLLSLNEIDDTFGEALGNAVLTAGSLEELNLESNQLGERSAAAFGVVLRTSGCALVRLCLANNPLGVKGGQKLAAELNRGSVAAGLLGREHGELNLCNTHLCEAASAVRDALQSAAAKVDFS